MPTSKKTSKNLKGGKTYYFVAISTLLEGGLGTGGFDSEIIEVTPEYARDYILPNYKNEK